MKSPVSIFVRFRGSMPLLNRPYPKWLRWLVYQSPNRGIRFRAFGWEWLVYQWHGDNRWHTHIDRA